MNNEDIHALLDKHPDFVHKNNYYTNIKSGAEIFTLDLYWEKPGFYPLYVWCSLAFTVGCFTNYHYKVCDFIQHKL